MFRDFFEDKFGRDLSQNVRWFDLLENSEEELTPEIRKTASKIINAHHIWNCRLKQVIPESGLTDIMPVVYWRQLTQANCRETIAFLDDFSAGEKIRYHDSEGVQLEQLTVDILFATLQGSAFYRGQLAILCEQRGIRLPVDL
jgi:hypothetical protein